MRLRSPRLLGGTAIVCATLLAAVAVTSAAPATRAPSASWEEARADVSQARRAQNGKIARVCAIYGYPGAKVCLNDPSGANPEWFPKDRFPLHLSAIDWSPNGRSLAITGTGLSGRADDCGCVYILRRTGRRTSVSPAVGGAADHPQWSPNGRKILFDDDAPSVDEESSGTHDIFVVNANGNGLRNLTRGAAGSYSGEGRWSPDGRRIAYQGSCGREDFSLCLMNADGSGKRALATLSRFRVSDWSPSGAKLLGTTYNHPGGIALFDVRTRRISFLTRRRGDNYPQYSPDGRWILFLRGAYLRIMRADGSNPRPITVGRNRQLGAAGWRFDWQPLPR